METKTVKKVKSVQSYSFKVIHYEDGSSKMERRNNGFSVVEVLGIASIIRENLMDIFKDAVKQCDEVDRKSKNSKLFSKSSPKKQLTK